MKGLGAFVLNFDPSAYFTDPMAWSKLETIQMDYREATKQFTTKSSGIARVPCRNLMSIRGVPKKDLDEEFGRFRFKFQSQRLFHRPNGMVKVENNPNGSSRSHKAIPPKVRELRACHAAKWCRFQGCPRNI